jgi:hypothetical protein
MASVIGVFQTADDRGRSSYPLGEFALAQARLCPQPVKQGRNLSVEQFLLVCGPTAGIVPNVPVIRMLKCS